MDTIQPALGLPLTTSSFIFLLVCTNVIKSFLCMRNDPDPEMSHFSQEKKNTLTQDSVEKFIFETWTLDY